MRYVAPTGTPDPFNESVGYVGRNLAAGTQGSRIPPRAVEHPQREIVNVIKEVLTPSESDTTQLLKAIRALISAQASSYAVLAHTEPSGTNAGNAPAANTWFTRKTNAIIADPKGIVTLSSDQFTLQAGRYLFQAYVLGEAVQRHMARLYNVSDAVVVDYSTTANANDAGSADLVNSYAIIFTEINIASTKTFRIEQRVDQVGLAGQTYGLGLSNTFGAPNRYTLITIQKVG